MQNKQTQANVGGLQLNGLADLLGRLAHFPQCDSQVLCPVGVQQGHLVGSLVNDLLLVHGEVNGWALSFSFKHLLKLINIQVLKDTKDVIFFIRIGSRSK